MKLALDLSLYNPAFARPFDPSQLFINGENGDFIDPNVLSSMTIERNGSGGPPAADVVVGRITGLINGLVFTAPSDAERPILRLSNGKYRLQFDGVNDYIETPTTTGFTSISNLGMVFWAGTSAYQFGRVAMNIRNADTTDRTLIAPFDLQWNSMRVLYNGSNILTSSGQTLDDGLMHSFIYSQIAATSHEGYEDGVLKSTSSTSKTTNPVLTAMSIGGPGIPSLSVFGGFIGGAIFINRTLMSNEIGQIHNWGIGKFGA